MHIHIHEQPSMPCQVQEGSGTSEKPWNLGITAPPKPTVADIFAIGRQCTITGSVSTETPYTEGPFEVDRHWPLPPQEVPPTPPQPDTTHTANANRQKTISDAPQQRKPLSEVAEQRTNAGHRTKGKRFNYSLFHTTGERQPLD